MLETTPSFDEFAKMFATGQRVPVYRPLLADFETPVSVYVKLKQLGKTAFLLESVEGGEQLGRYSFLGVNPTRRIESRGRVVTVTEGIATSARTLADGQDPLHIVQEFVTGHDVAPLEGLPRFIGGAVGYASYDLVRFFEKLPASADDVLDVPDCVFLIVDNVIVFDHVRHQMLVMTIAEQGNDPAAAYDAAIVQLNTIAQTLNQPLPRIEPTPAVNQSTPIESNKSLESFSEMVLAAKEYIAAGDAFQIVLSQRFHRQTTADPLSVYRALRMLNPSPYMFLFEFAETEAEQPFSVIGASPEMMVRLEDGVATVRPIAGTRRRGATPEEDAELAEDLLSDEKERAEHVMLIDLGRNDLGRVCTYGTVHVPRLMYVEYYSHVMHIVSQVEGRVGPGFSAYDLLRATFPAGTLSGAPKIRAMQIIEELEAERRGPYGGVVGYISYDGSMDTCITIRSVVWKDGHAYIQSGAGIVADSDPGREYEETVNKAKAVSESLTIAEQMIQGGDQ